MTQEQLIIKLKELQSLPAESEGVEFKEAKNDFHFDKIGKYFSALSNEANLNGKKEAWLIFGIENSKRDIVGSSYRSSSRAALDSLKAEIANKTTNRITFIEIHELAMPKGRVVMFQIPAAPQGIPIAWEGHYYGRDGEELSPLNIVEIERIREQVSRIDWSAGVCEGATIDDLDPNAIAVARQNFKVKNPRLTEEIDNWNDIVFLNKAKITVNGKVTRTAIILLGRIEAEHYISPSVAKITWILKDKDGLEKDYQHFSCPFILAVDQVFTKIRNLKHRYITDGTLFPEEVDQYDSFVIKEALSNCIVHQDYTLGGKIIIVESEDGFLSFTNLGEFLPGSIESIIESDVPPHYYRNSFLANAMVNLNMIDTIGSGIKRMFRLQSKRFFPMPDYELFADKVKTTLIGKVLDVDFARVLFRNPGLSLLEIFMLDKVQKHKKLSEQEISYLKDKHLIEGRKPNFIISERVASKTNQIGSYLKNRGFDKGYYQKLIVEFIQIRDRATKSEIRDLIWDKLPDILTQNQKEVKISNLLQEMREKKMIVNVGSDSRPFWKLM